MKLLSLCGYKLKAMFGGVAPMLVMCAVLLISCAAVWEGLGAKLPGHVAVLVVDLDQSEHSAALLSALEQSDGLRVTVLQSEADARRELSLGAAEGLLIVGKGYESALTRDEKSLFLHYESAPLAFSGQMVREIVSGTASRERSMLRARQSAEAIFGELTREQEAAFTQYLSLPAPEGYTIRTVNGTGTSAQGTVYGAFSVRYQGFGALCILLCMLTLSSFFGKEETRLTAKRMRALPSGSAMGALSDVLSLFFAGLAMAAAVLIPQGGATAAELVLLAAYVFALTGLCLLIGRFGRAAGRADVLSPFVALVTGLIGGCFMDLTSVSPELARLALFTPQGLLLAALAGDAPFALPALVASGFAALFAVFFGEIRFLKKNARRAFR